MNQDDYISKSGTDECKALLDVCTPYIYRRNAFRITGLLADATVRDVKRRIEDLKHVEEMGVEEEHLHAFALDIPPGLEQIRESALKLQDPESRIIQEFFWFWPLEWGNGRNDPALVALASADKKAAYNTWKASLAEKQSATSVVSKHNLAVLYQLLALDGELLCLDNEFKEETLIIVEKYWFYCFKFWEELTEDKMFWSLVANQIRSIDDPRVTPSFSQMMRLTLPKALHKINGMLAVQYIEKGKLERAHKHIRYMKETYRGRDHLSDTLVLITKPLQSRILSAINKATEIAERQPKAAAQAADDLAETVKQPLDIIRNILPEEDHNRIDLCDAVADTGLTCQIAFARETHDWIRSIAMLAQAREFAASEEMYNRITGHLLVAQDASTLDPIKKLCEIAFLVAKDSPENAMSEGQRLLTAAKTVLPKLDNGPEALKDDASNEIAAALMQCAVVYGNKTEDWGPCVNLLEESLRIAKNGDLKERIAQNLRTVKSNANFSDLKPISAPPPLGTIFGIGCNIYGATDHDAETGSYLTTYYFVILGIPVYPIYRYRVTPLLGSYQFLGKAPLRTFDRWHLFISLALTILFIFHSVPEHNKGSTYQVPKYSQPGSNVSSPKQYYDNGSKRISLKGEIEQGKRRAKEMESKIQDVDRRLEEYENKMNAYRALGATDDFNTLVPAFNLMVVERNDLYKEYSQLVTDINAKVKRYNSGYR